MDLRLLARAALPALAMSVGWGFRGDYGHEAGAMVPGALVALAVVLMSGRPDWWRRASLLALLGAAGWAFGGSMSYGRVIGYTAHSSFPDVAYGYASLFVIGALWGGLGAGVLALGVTRPRGELERFAGPLVAVYVAIHAMHLCGATRWLNREYPLHDTDWVSATVALVVAVTYGLAVPRARGACALLATLAGGWWLGYGLLVEALGLRMTPPRGDNWAGCAGVMAALAAWHLMRRDRAALWLACVGALAGGVGFAAGDFVQMLGRAGWGPLGEYEALRGLDYWKWMEQLFGLIMGLGVGLAFAAAARRLAPPAEEASGHLNTVALAFLLVAMMWENLWKNVRTWRRGGHLRDDLFGVAAEGWFLLVGAALTAAVVVAIVQHRRGRLPLTAAMGPFGRAQLLFLVLLWVPVIAALLQALPHIGRKGTLLVHTTFWLTGVACTLIALSHSGAETPPGGERTEDRAWRPGWALALLWAAVPGLVLLLAQLTTQTHDEPLPGSHRRFEPE